MLVFGGYSVPEESARNRSVCNTNTIIITVDGRNPTPTRDVFDLLELHIWCGNQWKILHHTACLTPTKWTWSPCMDLHYQSIFNHQIEITQEHVLFRKKNKKTTLSVNLSYIITIVLEIENFTHLLSVGWDPVHYNIKFTKQTCGFRISREIMRKPLDHVHLLHRNCGQIQATGHHASIEGDDCWL